jgi:carboxypeptidase Taq
MFFHNEIKITDLPEIWNKKMKEYLGVTPPNNREGVLQDVHWAYGLFGYFPTYNLGAIYASQIFEKVKEKIAGLEQRFAQGNFKPLKDWLNREVHERGSWLETNDLMQTITGETLNAQIHLNYLEQKYTEIYGL